METYNINALSHINCFILPGAKSKVNELRTLLPTLGFPYQLVRGCRLIYLQAFPQFVFYPIDCPCSLLLVKYPYCR